MVKSSFYLKKKLEILEEHEITVLKNHLKKKKKYYFLSHIYSRQNIV